ncbi:MAG: BNR repeat-containing protein, partial [Lacunisphaera sp.]
MHRFRLALMVCVALAGRTVSAAVPAGELIDHVWAGHPVSFALLVENDHQFVAYYDAERRLTVVGRKGGEGKWTRVQPPGVPSSHGRNSSLIGWDSHNFLRLALDRDGDVHLSGNMHVDPLVYYRTRLPFDLGTLERIDRMTGNRETHCTYPVFFKNAAGDIFFRYRDGSSGNGSDLYNAYDPATRTWRRLLDTPLLDGEGQRNAYALDPVLGPDGWFHVVWMWRDTPDCATNHTLSYARSRDFIHWENSRGEPLTLPITLATGEVIDAAKPGEGLINMTFNLGFDAQQRPVVVYHRYDSRHRSQVYAARPRANGAGWEIHQLSEWNFTWAFSGGGSIAADVSLGAPRATTDGSLAVDFVTRDGGSGRWLIDSATLERKATLPAAPPVLPDELMRPIQAGMEVQTEVAHANGRRWV